LANRILIIITILYIYIGEGAPNGCGLSSTALFFICPRRNQTLVDEFQNLDPLVENGMIHMDQ